MDSLPLFLLDFLPGAGTTSVLDGYFQGVITEIGTSQISVKVIKHVSASWNRDQRRLSAIWCLCFLWFWNVAIHTNGNAVATGTTSYTSQLDWFDQQTIPLSNSTIPWNNALLNRPGTSAFAAARSSRFDEVHVVVIDDKGTITGNAGTILEKHLSLSKAKDAEFSVGSPSYWRKYLATNSQYIFGGSAPSGIVTSSYSSDFSLDTDTGWDQDAQGTNFRYNWSKHINSCWRFKL
jgi:hypothetical protein